jgi:glycosyltransferase involved in cell wall biosynthesis
VVFAEASSFGVPSLATNVGGIPSAVKDGLNGKTFPPDADAEDYCDYVLNFS